MICLNMLDMLFEREEVGERYIEKMVPSGRKVHGPRPTLQNISNRILTHFPVELIQIEIIYSNIIKLTCYTRFYFCG